MVKRPVTQHPGGEVSYAENIIFILVLDVKMGGCRCVWAASPFFGPNAPDEQVWS